MHFCGVFAKIRAARPGHEIAPNRGHRLQERGAAPVEVELVELIDQVRPHVVLRAVVRSEQDLAVIKDLNVVAPAVAVVWYSEVDVDDRFPIADIRVAVVGWGNRLIAPRIAVDAGRKRNVSGLSGLQRKRIVDRRRVRACIESRATGRHEAASWIDARKVREIGRIVRDYGHAPRIVESGAVKLIEITVILIVAADAEIV